MVAVDERLPRQARSFAPYTSSKAEAERVLLSANERRKGFETIAIRPPMIWGKGVPMLDQMAETVRAGNWQWVDGGNLAMSTCHLDNLVDALILAADHGRGGEAYFVADAEEGTLKNGGHPGSRLASIPAQGRTSDHAPAAKNDRKAVHRAHQQGQERAWLFAPCHLERGHRGDDDNLASDRKSVV